MSEEAEVIRKIDSIMKPPGRPETDYDKEGWLSQDMELVIFGNERTPTVRVDVTDEYGVSWVQLDVLNEAGQIESFYCAQASAQVRKDLLRRPTNTSLRFAVQEGAAALNPDVTYDLNVNPQGVKNGKEYIVVFKGAKSGPGEDLRVLSKPGDIVNLLMILDPHADFKKIGGEEEQIVYTNQQLR